MSLIAVSNLTFCYEGSYDNILKMSLFRSTLIGSLGLSVETDGVRQLF